MKHDKYSLRRALRPFSFSVALLTCLVYVALLHVRFVTPARFRGLVTAGICILGCLAMLFNWIIVNYVLAGKHSYA